MVIKDAGATAQNTSIVPHPTAGNSNNLRVLLKKIIGRKINPELSSLEIEKLYNKKGMKSLTDIEEVPFDVSDIREKPNDSLDGVNLTRPVPKKGVKFEANDSLDGLNLPRPVPKKGVKIEANDSLERLNLTRSVRKKGFKFEKTDPLNGHTLTLPAPKKGVQLERSGDNQKPAPFLEKENVEEPISLKESLSEIQKDVALLQKPEPFVQNEDVEEAVNDQENLSEIQTDVSL
ncbi:hypothetical protein Tco_1413537 [Tanacetum coccineum]